MKHAYKWYDIVHECDVKGCMMYVLCIRLCMYHVSSLGSRGRKHWPVAV